MTSGVKDWLLYASYIKVKYKIQLCTTRQKRDLSVMCLVLLYCYYLHSVTRIWSYDHASFIGTAHIIPPVLRSLKATVR